jgi:formiminotetrahydrofolate cyclodeaminase
MDEQSPRLAGLTLTEFSERLASAEPVPGGGSASAFAAVMAASLTAMVARLSIDRPRYAEYRETIQRALDTAEHVRARMLELTDADAAAYGAYAAARRLPKDTEDQQSRREEASRVAAREASDVPLAVLRECAVLLEQIEAISGRSNVNAASDLEVGARLCAAGARGAAANVIVNLPQVGDERYAGVTKAEIGELMHTIERSVAQVVQRVAQGGLRGPESA